VFDADLGCAIRGSFLLDADGLVRWKVIHRMGEARDVRAHLAALADSRAAT
jgi:alkyl hydroperoxide reductase subunit AhpC